MSHYLTTTWRYPVGEEVKWRKERAKGGRKGRREMRGKKGGGGEGERGGEWRVSL